MDHPANANARISAGRPAQRRAPCGTPAARTALALALTLTMGGCYFAHGRDRDDPDGPGGTLRIDAGHLTPIDAGRGTRADARPPALDADPPLPPLPDDEPDVLPGERPSDGPAAADWEDPPATDGPHTPCCDVGELVPLDDERLQASPPAVAWDGAAWGVAWAAYPRDRTYFRRVDRDARPIAPLTTIPEIIGAGAMAWGNHRYGLVTAYPRGLGAAGIAILDRDGVVREHSEILGQADSGAIARYEMIHGWAAVTYADGDGGATGTSRVVVVDKRLEIVAEHELGTTRYADWRSYAVTSLVSSFVVTQATPDAIRLLTFAGPRAELTGELRFDVREGPLDDVGASLATGRLRDTVAIAVHRDGWLHSVIFDPFSNAIISGPHPIDRSYWARSPSVAGDDLGGTAGVCYPTGGTPRRDADALGFALLGPDGRMIGTPIRIATDLRYVAACAIAAAGRDEYVVVFWNAASDGTRPSILAARVRVRRPT